MKTKWLTLVAALFFGSTTFALAATNDLSSALQKGLFEEEANHNLDAAIAAYQSVATQFDKDRKLAATAIFRLGEVYRKQGKTNEADAQYERILREFSDQPELVKLSRTLGASGSVKADSGKASELEQLLVSAQADYEHQKTLLASLKGLSREQLKNSLPVINPDSQLDEIFKRLASAEQQLTLRKQEFTNGHPEVKEAQAIVDLIKQQLNDRIDGDILGLETKMTNSKSWAEELQRLADKGRKDQLNEATRAPASQPAGQIKPEISSEDQEIARLKAMIKDSPDLINAPINNGLNPLGYAAMMGQLRVVEFLLANGADVNRKSQNRTALHWAVENGHKAMVELLVSHDADLEAKDGAGDTPLHVAARMGFKAIAEILLAHKADVDAKGNSANFEQTPLHLAARAGNQAVAQLLLKNEAEISAKDSEGKTSLFSAIESKDFGMTKLLIANKADVNAKTTNGVTPLLSAIFKRSLEITKLLIENKADVNATNADGQTPLFAAIDSKNLEIAKFLIANKADVNAVAGQALTPLFRAVFTSQPKLVELLLQSGANTEAKLDEINYRDWTPLHFAARGEKEIAEMLLNHGANPNSRDAVSDTPLQCAVGQDKPDIAELLLAHKADVNAQAKDGYTPLLWAVRNAQKPMIELLLKYKADPNLANNKNETPLGIVNSKITQLTGSSGQAPSSEREKWKEIGELLIQYGADENQERRMQIAVTRNGAQRYVVFFKGTNSWNRFSLLEAVVPSVLPFPNLLKIKIHRLEGKKEREIPVDVEAILKSGDCSKDVWLEWGDVIEIPEADHPVLQNWTQLPQEFVETVQKCLERTVSITVKGNTTNLTLKATLSSGISYGPNGPEPKKWSLNFWLSSSINVYLRASSDKTRVRVKRTDPVTKKAQEIIVNLEKQDDLWLRDGDAIEIPERDPNEAPTSSNNSQIGILPPSQILPGVAVPPPPARIVLPSHQPLPIPQRPLKLPPNQNK